MRGGNLFEQGTGWDGANGPWVFHIIDINNNGSSIAKWVGPLGHTELYAEDWTGEGDHLNNFRLELVYE
jgi:hypothetical protein